MLATEKLQNDITVYGYSQRFVDEVRRVLVKEGGHVNDPVDRGGETKYGISLRFLVAAGDIDKDADGFADFDLDMDGDIDGADIRKLTTGDAIYLYYVHFWKKYECDHYPKPLGEAIFDQAVNGGGRAAQRLLQQALNILPLSVDIADDGRVGMQTRAALDEAIRRHSMDEIIDAYRKAARIRYRSIVARNPSQQRFLRGWLNRANAIGVL